MSSPVVPAIMTNSDPVTTLPPVPMMVTSEPMQPKEEEFRNNFVLENPTLHQQKTPTPTMLN